MNTKTRLFTGAVALVLAATSVLSTAPDASARPRDDDRYSNGRDNGAAWWKRDRELRRRVRDDRYNDRRVRFNNRDAWSYDRDYYRDDRRNVYINQPYQRYQTYPSNAIVRLPDGCRRVVYRDRTYYTRDNNQYYTYDSNRRGFIVVNFPGVRIGF